MVQSIPQVASTLLLKNWFEGTPCKNQNAFHFPKETQYAQEQSTKCDVCVHT